jgi:hypothetical protein
MANKPYRIEPYQSKTGVIPPDNFENDMGPPTPIESFMSKEDVEKFRAETERLRIGLEERNRTPKRKPKS